MEKSFEKQPRANKGEMRNPAPGWKRTVDCALIVLLSPLWVPVMVIIAALIRLVSSGPILFRQERVGSNGSRFVCLKFRTMSVGADTKVHQSHLDRLMTDNVPMVKMDEHGDPRLIPIGRLLRSSGLDELPQIFNVLRGDMSLVGPRPCLLYEFEKYTKEQKRRFETLPGLTGLWQVSGKNRTTFAEMIQLDIDYVERRSLWLDFVIIFKTGPMLIVEFLKAIRTKKTSVGSAQNGLAASGCVQPATPFPAGVSSDETKM